MHRFEKTFDTLVFSLEQYEKLFEKFLFITFQQSHELKETSAFLLSMKKK